MTSGRRDLTTWRGIFPRELRERMAFFGLVFGLLFGVMFDFFIVYPQYYDYWTPFFYANLCFVIFVLFNIYGNLYKLMSVDASGRSSDLPSILKPEWKYCYICRLNSPPRSYHCTQCEECILKRDLHCVFGGCCIGYHNHRFYVLCCFYASLLCQYMFWWHWTYIWETLGGFSLSTCWYIFFPQFAIIFGQIGLWQFFMSGVMMSSIVVFLGSTNMFLSQALLILRGQSQHEYMQNIRSYDLGFALNIQDVVGTRWPIAWICPFFNSPLLGDGLRFPDRKEVENIKDM